MNNENKIKSLQQRIYNKIPITKHIGFKIDNYEETSITASAPLEVNKNDKGTGFAGSLYSVLALSGWAFVTQKLEDEKIDAEAVVYSGNITYHKPVTNNFTAICTLPSIDEWLAFKERLMKRKNAKIVLPIKILHNDELKVSFTGEYFAWIKKIDE